MRFSCFLLALLSAFPAQAQQANVANRAAKGSIVQIFATGGGSAASTVQVFFGSAPAQVIYSGTTQPGLWQINAQVPDGVSGQVPLFLVAGKIASNAVTIWVE